MNLIQVQERANVEVIIGPVTEGDVERHRDLSKEKTGAHLGP
jgi:hypothetical protein